MKKVLLLLISITILFTGCSSLDTEINEAVYHGTRMFYAGEQFKEDCKDRIKSFEIKANTKGDYNETIITFNNTEINIKYKTKSTILFKHKVDMALDIITTKEDLDITLGLIDRYLHVDKTYNLEELTLEKIKGSTEEIKIATKETLSLESYDKDTGEIKMCIKVNI